MVGSASNSSGNGGQWPLERPEQSLQRTDTLIPDQSGGYTLTRPNAFYAKDEQELYRLFPQLAPRNTTPPSMSPREVEKVGR